MGQSSIHILNKNGYSMFWNSMWDNKISYSRYLSEDIFIKNFLNLIFNDNLSLNLLNKRLFFLQKSNIYNLISDKKQSSINNYLSSLNRVELYYSKVWLMRYQNWIVLYYFLYINDINKNYKKNENNLFLKYGNTFYFLQKFYLKSVFLNKIRYSKKNYNF